MRTLNKLLLAALLLAAGHAHAFDVVLANGSSSNGSWQANNTWVPSGVNSVVSHTEVLARLANGPVTIQATGSDTIHINTPLTWNANTLSLQAGGNIRFNSGMSLTGTSGLVLEWGQAGLDVDSDWGYFLGNGVKIDLADNTSFKTRRGSNGALVNYSIITRIGTDLNGTYDPNGLQWMGVNAALGADIDASITSAWNAGKHFVPGFRSRFAGLGHSIDGLHMRALEAHVPDAAQRSTRGGLFTTVDYVQDLRLTNLRVEVQDGNFIGGVAGVLNGRIQNVHVAGEVIVTGSNFQSIGGLAGQSWGRILDSSNAATVTATDSRKVGGLIGTLQAQSGRIASIERSRNTGAVTGSVYVGGLAGHITAANYLTGTKAQIVNSHNTGTVTGTTLYQRIGGLVGASEKGEILDSSSIATVTTTNSRGQHVGGLVGEAWGSVIWGSYSGGQVSGKWQVGGLVGSMIPLHKQYGEYVGSIERSFSAASVVHSDALQYAEAVGGLVGDARGVKISQSFATGPVNVQEGYSVGGLVGLLSPHFTGTGLDQVCHGVPEERSARVDNSYSLSAVTAVSGGNIGGLIGRMYWTTDGGARMCKARVVNSYAAGALNWGWSTATYFGGLIGRNDSFGADAVVKSFWDTGRTDISTSAGGEPQGNMGSWFFYYAMGDYWDFNGIWHVNQSASRDVLPGLRSIRAQHPVDVRMTAEVTYNGTPSVWDGITPTLTYSIGGTVIPNPGIRPALVEDNVSIGSANPGWQAGTYTQPVSGVDTEQFNFTYSGGLTVRKAPLTVRVQAVNKTYDDTAFTPTAGNVQITGFVGGENASVLQGTLTFSGSGVGARHVGSYSLTPGGLSAANYEITYVSGPVNINKRPITLRPVSANKPYDGTVYSSQSPAIVSGSIAGDDVITNLAQQYDAEDVGVRALSISPEYVIQDGNGGHNYQVGIDATPVTGTITPVSLVIRANDASKPYDGNPYSGGNGVQYFGFVNGEDASVLQGTLTYGGSSQGATAIGTGYVIAPSGLSSPQGNYTVQFQNGILTIANRALTVRANDATRVYDGTAWSGGNGIVYEGFMDGDDETTPGILTGTLTYGGDSQGAVNAGSYAITPAGLSSNKYDITFVPGTLTTTRAPLTIRADDKERDYNGHPFNEYTATFTGLVNGETEADLQGTLTYRLRGCANCWVTSPVYSTIGGLTIVPGGLTSTNYAISYVNGRLDVNKLPLTITAPDVTQVYNGQALSDPGLAAVEFEGFLPGENIEQQIQLYNQLYNGNRVLDGALYNFAATQPNVGTYPVQVRIMVRTPPGAPAPLTINSLTGYTITYVNGTFTVTPAPLSITANDDARPNGSPAYSGGNGVVVEGFVNGETDAVLGGALTYGGSSQGATAEGFYEIVPGGHTATNYAIDFIAGTLTIGNPNLTYGIATSTSPATGGSIVCTPTQVTPGQDSTCTVTANTGFIFTGWDDDCAHVTPIDNPTCTLSNVQADKFVQAQFAAITTFNGTTLPASGPGGAASASLIGGGDACRFDPGNTAFVAAPAELPPGQTLPQGMFAFSLLGCDTSATPVTMSIIWPEAVDGYIKHGLASAVATQPSYFLPNGLVINLNTVQFTVQDGQLGDDDWEVNGVIIDPSGPTGVLAHAITVTPSANGSVVCVPNPVPDGGSAVCTATPNSGYSIGSWGDACAATPAGNSTCTLTNVQAPQTVSVSFTQITHAITVTPSANGSVVCAPNPVPDGGSAVCTATPNSGYSIGSWGDACAATPVGSASCTLSNVQAPQTVSVSFTQITHAITVTPGANGNVACVPNPVPDGGSAVCTATPNSGYSIGAWGDACAATPAGNSTCTLTNVQAPQTVSVSFTQITHAITVTPSANGSVVCAPNPVPDGGSAVCTATPDTGYAVGTWGDACAATPAGSVSCTLSNVQAPQTVSVSFTQITHAITVTPSANGSVVCAPNPVPDGGSTVCTATPDTGYAVSTWGDACTATPAGSASCTLSNVQAPQTVSVSFTQITHAITVTPSANGSVVCAPNPVPDGGSAVCTATPNSGYSIGAWGDACAATPAGSASCTLNNVQAPQTVSVSFTQITHAIIVTPSANGSVVCAPNPVPDGGSTVCTATPDMGYAVGTWGDACAATPAGSASCTLSNVQAPQTVSVSFTQITHAITVTPSANGSVVCAPNPVPDGGSAVCTATPNSGYSIGTWGDACAATPAGSASCTLNNVQAPQTVSVSFTQITHAITVTPSANGSVVCAPNPVPDGGSAVCTATPDAGFTLTAWQGDCAGTPAASLSCTLANVRAASGVSAQFAAFGPAPQIQFVPALDRSMQALLVLLAFGLGLMALRTRRD